MCSCREAAGGESSIGNRRAAAAASILYSLASGAARFEVAPDAVRLGPLDGQWPGARFDHDFDSLNGCKTSA